MASFISWVFGDSKQLPAIADQVLSPIESKVGGLANSLLMNNKTPRVYCFDLLYEGERVQIIIDKAVPFGEVAEAISRAASKRQKRLEEQPFKDIPRLKGSNPFDRALVVDEESDDEGVDKESDDEENDKNSQKNQKTTTYVFFDSRDLLDKPHDTRKLKLPDGTVIQCSTQTLRDFRRWGDNCLTIDGENIHWIDPKDVPISLSDGNANDTFQAPQWIEKAHRLMGADHTVFSRMIQRVNQRVLNLMLYQAQIEFKTQWKINLFPDSNQLRRTIEVVDGTLSKLTMSISSFITKAQSEEDGSLKSCDDFEAFAYFHGIVTFYLGLGYAIVEMHESIKRDVLEKHKIM